jgi:hypothetical protein
LAGDQLEVFQRGHDVGWRRALPARQKERVVNGTSHRAQPAAVAADLIENLCDFPIIELPAGQKHRDIPFGDRSDDDRSVL